MYMDRVFIILRDKVTVDISESLYVSDLALVYSNNKTLQKNIEKLKIFNGLKIGRASCRERV